MTTHEVVLPLFSPMAQTPEKRYRTIVADPPWRYTLRANDKTHQARVTYGTMSEEELMCLPVGLWGNGEGAHLYLWTTNNFMAEAHRIARAWGFDIKTILTWVKRKPDGDRWIGLGNYFRATTEHILFGVSGSLPVLNKDQSNLVETLLEMEEGAAFWAPRGIHSEKPAAFYDIVEHMSPGPYLDVFARKRRLGWDVFGNESYNPTALLETLAPEQREGLIGGG